MSLEVGQNSNMSNRMLKPGETLDFDYSLDKPEDLDVWSDEYIPVIGQFYGRGDGGRWSHC